MSSDNRYKLNDCEANTGWTGDDSATVITTTGSFIEGSGALSTQLSNADEQMSTTEDSTATGTFSVNMSDMTIYMNVKDNLGTTYALGGIQFVIGDGTDLTGYDVAGNDAVGMPHQLFFSAFKLDVSEAVATPGGFTDFSGTEANLNHNAITEIGYGSLHLAKAVGAVDNVIMDGFYYIANDSFALTINGGTIGTPETMDDVVTDDEASGWGLVNNPLGKAYGLFSPTEWGDTAATADSYFQADDEQWFLIGDNAGGRAIGATHMPFRVVSNATDTGSFVLNNVVVVSTGTRADFDFSDTDIDNLELTGVTFTDVNATTFQVQDAGNKFLAACVFNNCGRTTPSTMDFDNITFNGTTDADGAIGFIDNTSANMSNITFNSDGTGHAVELAPTATATYTFDNWNFVGYANDAGTAANRCVLVPSGVTNDITINWSGGSLPSVDNQGSGSVTVTNTVTVTFTGMKDNTEVRVYTAGTTTELDGIENATAGSPDDRSFAASVPAATSVDYVLISTDYEIIRVNSFTWPAANQNLPISQRFDRNYDNP